MGNGLPLAAAVVIAAACSRGAASASSDPGRPDGGEAASSGWAFEGGGALSLEMASSQGGYRLIRVGSDRGILVSPGGAAAAVRQAGSAAAGNLAAEAAQPEAAAPTAELRAAIAAARLARESQRAPCPWDATDDACSGWCSAVAPSSVKRPVGRAQGAPCSGGGSVGPTCQCGQVADKAGTVWATCRSNCSAPRLAPRPPARGAAPLKAPAAAEAPQPPARGATPPEAPAAAEAAAGRSAVAGAPSAPSAPGKAAAAAAAAAAATRYLLYDTRFGTSFFAQLEVLFTVMKVVKELNAQVTAACTGAGGGSSDLRCAPWALVLPPWCAVVHWYSEAELPWRELFDVAALGKEVPVVEFEAFNGSDAGRGAVGVDFAAIAAPPGGSRGGGGGRGDFLGWSAGTEGCEDLLTQPRSVKGGMLVDYAGYCSAKVLAQDLRCGGLRKPSWRALADLAGVAAAGGARHIFLKSLDAAQAHSPGGAAARHFHPSLRPAPRLVAEADRFISSALGGLEFLAAHLRRNEFRRHHPEAVPDAAAAALRLNHLLKELHLEQVFVATDATDGPGLSRAGEGFREELRRRVKAPLYYFAPDDGARMPDNKGQEELIVLHVLSRAAHFVGTEHSAYSAAARRERLHMGKTQATSEEVFCAGILDEPEGAQRRCVAAGASKAKGKAHVQ